METLLTVKNTKFYFFFLILIFSCQSKSDYYLIEEINEEKFLQLIQNDSINGFYFFSPNCENCESTYPEITDLKQKFKNISFYSINADSNLFIMGRFSIYKVPTLFITKSGSGLIKVSGNEIKMNSTQKLDSLYNVLFTN